MANSETFEYVKLLDVDNYGLVIKCKGHLQYVYRPEKREWIRTGLLTKYFCDEDPCYELYEEITEDKALKLIKAYK